MNTPRKRIEHRTPSRAALFCMESGEMYVALRATGERVSTLARTDALNYFGSLASWSAHVVLCTFAGCHCERVLP